MSGVCWIGLPQFPDIVFGEHRPPGKSRAGNADSLAEMGFFQGGALDKDIQMFLLFDRYHVPGLQKIELLRARDPRR